MSLDRSAVEHVARLARIALDPAQTVAMQAELGGILELVAQLQAAQVTDVEPLSNPLELSAPSRTDVVSEADARAQLQAVAPSVEAGYYLVPRVIE
jgi:aspartyl-tRNA(Asn)/glutamyl-tRNA(Gln) amidotransferase subunit C